MRDTVGSFCATFVGDKVSPTYLFPKVLRYAKQSLLYANSFNILVSIEPVLYCQRVKHKSNSTYTPEIYWRERERNGVSCPLFASSELVLNVKSGFGEAVAQISQAEIRAAHQVNSMWGNKFGVQVLDMLNYMSWQEAALTVHHHSFSYND